MTGPNVTPLPRSRSPPARSQTPRNWSTSLPRTHASQRDPRRFPVPPADSCPRRHRERSDARSRQSPLAARHRRHPRKLDQVRGCGLGHRPREYPADGHGRRSRQADLRRDTSGNVHRPGWAVDSSHRPAHRAPTPDGFGLSVVERSMQVLADGSGWVGASVIGRRRLSSAVIARHRPSLLTIRPCLRRERRGRNPYTGAEFCARR